MYGIRPYMLYGMKCWAIKTYKVNKMSIADMRRMRWTCGKTLQDRIRNSKFCGMVGVAPIEDKVRENRFRWFGHVYRRSVDACLDE